jgi:hypothetical protein
VKHGITRPALGDALIDLGLALRQHGARQRRLLQREAACQTQVPQEESDQGRQLLTRQVVADDPTQGQLAVLLCEAVLLGISSEVGLMESSP